MMHEGGEVADRIILTFTADSCRIINKRLVKDNDQVMDEIRVLEGLDHPHIVHVWDHFESRDK